MTIGKVLGAGLVGLVLVAGMPASSEAGHRHDGRCGHSRSYRSRTYSRSNVYRDSRSNYRDSYYDRGYGRGVDYEAPYVARHGSGRGYYDAPAYYYRAPRHYYSARPVYRSYHHHGRSRCYQRHSGFGIHLHIGR
jgi:hypothetical protein